MSYSLYVKRVRICCGLLVLYGISTAQAQAVRLGPEGHSPKGYCEQFEPLHANLVLTADTNINGLITDETTAPFRRSAVELRRFISATKQVTVKKTATDDEGRFDLGTVKRGQYRLLLSPSRAFKQPEKLECWSSKKCTLETALVANPTDQLTTNCPIR